jgi:hypothetical protein
MIVNYPDTTIWYVEAHSGKRTYLCGSAVRVWLQKIGEPRSRRIYLLTCGHVIRDEKGYGTRLDDIRVWAPGMGFDPNSCFSRAKVAAFFPFSSDAVPHGKQTVVDDWVVLDVVDDKFQGTDGNDVVRKWSGATNKDLAIVGYPNGRDRIKEADNCVVPLSKAGFSLYSAAQAVLTYSGNGETRNGMSGGGVFDGEGSLRGLHRSKLEPTLSGQAVSVSQVEARLKSLGYERGEDRIAIPLTPTGPVIEPSDNQEIAAVPRGLESGRLVHFDDDGNTQNGIESNFHEFSSVHPAFGTCAEPPVMSTTEFDQLRARLLTERAQQNGLMIEGLERSGLEGFFPSFNDHRLAHYIDKIAAKIRESPTHGAA